MAGQVEVVKGLGTENARVLAKRGPEEIFGEMALLGMAQNSKRSRLGPG